MSPRQGAALLLTGLWLGVLLASWVAATASFRGVEHVLGPAMRPELEVRLAPLEPEVRRRSLRHLAAETNRWLFRRLGLGQVALALLTLAAAWPSATPRLLLAIALSIAVVQVGLGTHVESFGRSLDFLPRPLPAELGRRFGLLHAGFLLLDAAKAILLLAAGQALARRSF